MKSKRDPLPCHFRKAPMCELLRFSLIRELRLSTNHFHYFDLHGIFLEREVGIRSIGDLQFSGCRVFVCNVDLCRVLSSSVLVSSVQLPTSMSNFGGTWDNAEKDISTSELLPMVLTLRANMLMTLFYHMLFCHHSTCMWCGGDVCPLDRSNGNLHT